MWHHIYIRVYFQVYFFLFVFSTNEGVIGADCSKNFTNAQTYLECSADSKLDKNENFKVSGYFDISRARLIPNRDMNNMKTSIQVTYGQSVFM